MTIEKKWVDLSPEGRREDRFKRWLSPPDIKFPILKPKKVTKQG